MEVSLAWCHVLGYTNLYLLKSRLKSLKYAFESPNKFLLGSCCGEFHFPWFLSTELAAAVCLTSLLKIYSLLEH